MELEKLIRELQTILDEADVVSIVRDVMVKFVVALVVFWILLLGLGYWMKVLGRK